MATNITLGLRGLPGTNTIAYYENPYITVVKSFTAQAPGEEHLIVISDLFANVIFGWEFLTLPNTLEFEY